jgi:hypothetical protein
MRVGAFLFLRLVRMGGVTSPCYAFVIGEHGNSRAWARGSAVIPNLDGDIAGCVAPIRARAIERVNARRQAMRDGT